MPPPAQRAHQDEIIICQLARLGDLAQTLRLIDKIGGDCLSLLCDSATESWARLLPRVTQIRTLDTRRWRLNSLENLDSLPHLLEDLKREFPHFREEPKHLFLLNDHSLENALTAFLPADETSRWLTPELILVRSYIHLIAAQQKANRIHLADLWASLESGSPLQPLEAVRPTTRALHYAESHLGKRNSDGPPIWTILLGSGSPHRRIEPETWSNLMRRMPAEGRPKIALVGGPGEEALAERFLKRAAGSVAGIANLIGKCSPEETVGVFAHSDLVLGVDTGPLHWAAAAGCRVIGFYFGEAGFHSTGPYGNGNLVIAPVCAEYPCHPSRARQCQWQCRRAFDQSELSDLILHLWRQNPDGLQPAVPGLRICSSTVRNYGNEYLPTSGGPENAEFDGYANFVRLVFGLTDNLAPAAPPMDEDGKLVKSLRFFSQIWESEIDQLTLPKWVSQNLSDEIKSRAKRRQSEMLAKYIHHEHSVTQRRLFSGQPAPAGA